MASASSSSAESQILEMISHHSKKMDPYNRTIGGGYLDLPFMSNLSFLVNFEMIEKVYNLRHSISTLSHETQKALSLAVFYPLYTRGLTSVEFVQTKTRFGSTGSIETLTLDITTEIEEKLIELAKLLPFKKRTLSLLQSEMMSIFHRIVSEDPDRERALGTSIDPFTIALNVNYLKRGNKLATILLKSTPIKEQVDGEPSKMTLTPEEKSANKLNHEFSLRQEFHIRISRYSYLREDFRNILMTLTQKCLDDFVKTHPEFKERLLPK